MGGIRCLSLRLFFCLALALIGSRAAVSEAAVTVESGIVFCRSSGTPLALDLARPEGAGPFPAIVFVHGGAWLGGDRGMYAHEIREQAAPRGFVAVSLDYRLLDPDRNDVARHPFPAQIEDVRCAIRFLRANAAKLGIDSGRIGATGHSAGGHLSLLAGLADPERAPGAEWAEQSSRVQAVVNQSGPTDLASLARSSDGARSLMVMLLPGPIESLATRAAGGSPVAFVTPDDPPVLTIHGERDETVPVEQALLLDSALAAAGVKHALLVLPGERHVYARAGAISGRERMYAFFAEALSRDSAR